MSDSLPVVLLTVALIAVGYALLRAELRAAREEQARLARELREELRAMGREGAGQLDARLGDSFRQVSERLEAVQRGLGEMQGLATGVGDLKRALTNVKTRGVFGEVQLQALLEQILTPDQYVQNYRPRAEEGEVVEFAVKFPGAYRDGEPVYLPIDAKFPQEDYQRILAASDSGDAEAVRAAQGQLVTAVKKCAGDIRDKYLHPPATTDFGVLFLPTEGLYAEVLRNAGMVEQLQREYRVTVAGPTTLAALLMSLRVGFRTLAIEERSSEIWRMLGAVRTEFGKFGGVLERLQKQLATAARTVEEASTRTRAMERKLRGVETLPDGEARELLGLGEGEGIGEEG